MLPIQKDQETRNNKNVWRRYSLGMWTSGMGLQSVVQALSPWGFGIRTFWASGPAPHTDRSPRGTRRCRAHQGLRPRRGWQPTPGGRAPCWDSEHSTQGLNCCMEAEDSAPDPESCCGRMATLKPTSAPSRGQTSVCMTSWWTGKEMGNFWEQFWLVAF